MSSLRRVEAVLFDLDHTLLDLAPDFVARYLDFLQAWVGPRVRRWGFAGDFRRAATDSLATAVHGLAQTPRRPLADRFFVALEAATGLPRARMEPLLARFHAVMERRLADQGRPVPGVLGLLASLQGRGIRIALVTNPVFPLAAIRARLRWGGLEAVPFRWISCLEEAVAAKPAIELYRQAAARLGVDPTACLMVGDDWANDIVPAQAAGMATLWVGQTATADGRTVRPSAARLAPLWTRLGRDAVGGR